MLIMSDEPHPDSLKWTTKKDGTITYRERLAVRNFMTYTIIKV